MALDPEHEELITRAVQRAMSSSKEARRQIVREAVAEELERRRSVNAETHKHHHDFIATYMAEYEHRKARWEQRGEKVFGAFIVAAVSGALFALWEGIRAIIRAKGG